MPRLFISTFHPNEGMDDEWSLFLNSSPAPILCRVTGSYMAYEKSITLAKPEEDLRWKESVFLGVIKEANVDGYREVLQTLDVNNHASFFNSHVLVRTALERLEQADILDTRSPAFRAALKWIRSNYASGLP